jgi:hypothetical protein
MQCNAMRISLNYYITNGKLYQMLSFFESVLESRYFLALAPNT